MTGKVQQNKGKRVNRSKKSREKQRQDSPVAAAAVVPEAVKNAPVAVKPKPMTKETGVTVSHLYVKGEMARIAIFGGITVIILVILALVLS